MRQRSIFLAMFFTAGLSRCCFLPMGWGAEADRRSSEDSVKVARSGADSGAPAEAGPLGVRSRLEALPDGSIAFADPKGNREVEDPGEIQRLVWEAYPSGLNSQGGDRFDYGRMRELIGKLPPNSPQRQILEKFRDAVVEGALAAKYGPQGQALREASRVDMEAALVQMGSGSLDRDGFELLRHRGLLPVVGRIVDDPEQLRQTFRRAFSRRSKSPDNALVWVSRRHLRMNFPQDSWEYASDAIHQNPQNEEAYATRALASYQLRHYGAARRDALVALRLNASDQAAMAILKLSQGREEAGRFELAEERVQNIGGGIAAGFAGFSASDPSTPSSAGVGNPAPPSSAASVPIGSGVSNIAASASLTNSVAAKINLGDFDAAIQEAGLAIQLNEQNAQAYTLRAMANIKQGQYRDAVADTQAAERLVGRPDRTVLNTRAYALNRLREYGPAKSAVERILAADPNDADALYSLANAEAGLGDRDAMMSDLRRAAEANAARYGSAYQAALQAPSSADLSLLFSGAGGASGGEARRPEPPSGSNGLSHFALILASSLLGGFLIAFGFFRAFFPQVFGREKNVVVSANAIPPGPGSKNRVAAASTVASGKYRILRQIGGGGMGAVYEAIDVSLERTVAIKKMREEIGADPRERQRFIREARLVAALHHPNIVDIYSIVEDEDGEVYLVFELVEGDTFHAFLQDRGRLPFEEVRRLFKGVCAALDFAHQRGVIHRDLKPSNIMMTQDGMVKVMDFGVARQAKDAASKMALTNTVCGTPAYMAPEAEQGIVRKESDIYSLGVCFYELLTGGIPFPGVGAGMLRNKMNMTYQAPSRLVPRLPSGVDALVARALQPDPERRIQSVVQFLRELENLTASG